MLILSNKRFEAAPLSANGDLISGTVKTENNTKALAGVSILIKGTQVGTITDTKGEFSMKIASFPSTLVFAFPGFAQQEIVVAQPQQLAVNLSPNNSGASADWEPGPNPLYIVDGKKVDSINEIDPETIESISVLKAQSGIELYGQEAQDGVIDIKLKKEQKKRKKQDERITAIGSGAPETAIVQIRSTKNASAKPLIIVDGVNKGNIDVKSLEINPENIKSIDVLKGESAIEKYGEEGKDGVILITTKR
ncbi:carboxypeptidase-like regulatory domain-containing protein [Mangrovibacterium diazotrophicum]|uniref:TonB-dependent receptor-like protein n=1 Tax=Mangrovibacterium diazotrophicum TaxID=1261403 RepID=A0A419WBN7_9BACT|nr:carboxypeptidase-like regulatory domain-containing protein [Mangrovibacterium diazotrophicum]RKD92834.1 TonB-dependent receptor-like protein [Mangrovibacterium diazotrophicum]